MIRRREFMTVLGGAAAWPLAARAQQGDRVRRIGVLMGRGDENDPMFKTFLSAFTQALAGLSWTDGRNVRMDLRWGGGDTNRIRAFAQELVGLRPDIILAGTTPATVALQRETRTIPIVFAGLSDPVASGIVPGLNQPSGNITGFGFLEAALACKWLELLSEIAPGLKRAAIMFNPDTSPPSVYIPSFETAARSLKVEATSAAIHSDAEIETAITALGREPGGALSSCRIRSWSCIARRSYWRWPETTCRRSINYLFARDGGLLSYGNDYVDLFRRAATYVDRILRGKKPGDLPVQLPTKFEMVVNLKTAKALGLTVPLSIRLRADEVIE